MLITFLLGGLFFPTKSLAEHVFEEVFNKHGVVMLVIDPSNGQITRANPAASQFYGYPQKQLEQMSIQQINTLTREQVADERNRAKTEQRNYFIFRHRLANGSTRSVEVHSYPIDFDGKTLLFSIIIDISEKTELKDAVMHNQQQLEQTIQQQTDKINLQNEKKLIIVSLGSSILMLLLVLLWISRNRTRILNIELESQQKSLSEVNERLTLAAESADFSVWDWNLVSNELMWDKKGFDLLGLDEQNFQLTPDNWKKCIHPEDLDNVQNAISLAIKGELNEIEYQVILPSGLTRDIRSKAVLISDNNEPVRLTGVSFDITDKKKAEQEIKDSEQRYRTIVDTIAEIGEGLFIVDSNYQIRYMNKVMIDWFGDQTGKTCYQAVAGLENKCPYCKLDEIISDGITTHYVPTTDDGRTFEIVATPILNLDGSTSKMEVIRDITSRKNAELQLEQRIQELTGARKASLNMMQDLNTSRMEAEQANQSKSQFLANMSHEIRTPLNAVTGMSYLLKQTQLTDNQNQYVDTIHNSMTHVTGIIDDLLDYSKAEAGKLELESIAFDLDHVLDNLTEITLQKAEVKNIELLFDIPLHIPRNLIGDPTRLGQILINLTGNAVKFCDKGEVVIAISVEQTHRSSVELIFSIRDSGIGMTETQISHLFEAFKQADSSITRRYGGTGLGLTISKYLINSMGGDIHVTSSPDEGSIFTFNAIFKLQSEQKNKLFHLPDHLKNLKLLIVDDNSTSCEILASILSSLSFEYEIVNSGQEAIDSLLLANQSTQYKNYDLVLLDWMMPDMNGVETAIKINHDLKLDKPPMIIMVSGYDREKVMSQASLAGLNGYIHKPVNASVLFDAMMMALGENLPKAYQRGQLKNQTVSAHIDGGGRRILIVEDQPTNRLIAVEILVRNGFTVESVENGELAVKLIKKDPSVFDCILMDLQMPVMDGYDATLKIRQFVSKEDLPIIAMTAHAFEDEKQKCFDAGMNAHISKPIDIGHLLAELSQWLDIKPQQPLQEDNITNIPLVIRGIDINDGLQRVMGNRQLYFKLLEKFPEQYDEILQSIHYAISKNDIETAEKAAHTLSGSAANLSMNPLHAAAKHLQNTLISRQNHTDALAQLDQQFSLVINSITEFLKKRNSISINGEDKSKANVQLQQVTISDDTLAKLLNELATMLDTNDMRASQKINGLLKVINNKADTKILTDINNHIEQLNFSSALKKIKAFAQSKDISLASG
ncbi:MAG: response regulator [Gammaproteobacteria bacterium]|nr:response regulator [Gammaproteobacteria bacterium]